jgi:phosphoadenosine phosphosulfate reductase
MQLTFEGKTIDQVSIELIQAYEPPEGYYLGFSGGKDSVVIYDLTKRAGVKVEAVYNFSPIDPPEIKRFIKAQYPSVIWENHAQQFFTKHFLSHGPPFRKTRWCCEIIKEAGGKNRIKILGMRRAESKKRAGYKCFTLNTVKANCSKNDIGATLLPILNWSNTDVWQYIAERNLRTCVLYSQGWKRIGCLLCPNAKKSEIRLTLKRYPKIVQAYKNAFNAYYQARIDRDNPIIDHASGEEYFNWWIRR